MKKYEAVTKTKLVPKVPVIIRLDGKAFHSFTRGFEKPFDKYLMATMNATMQYLCENIQGCLFGYTQSDEITLVLGDYKNIDSSAWFDYQVQKIVSVSSSMATLEFNRKFREIIECNIDYIDEKQLNAYNKAIKAGALFDARVFNLPMHEVENCLIWRQQDASKNSIQMLARSEFKHSELQGLSCNELQEKLFSERGINWNNIDTYKKRGSCCVKREVELTNGVIRNKWIIDLDIPIFTQDREYIRSQIGYSE